MVKILVLRFDITRGEMIDSREIMKVDSAEEYCRERIAEFIEDIDEDDFERMDDDLVGWRYVEEGFLEISLGEEEMEEVYVLK